MAWMPLCLLVPPLLVLTAWNLPLPALPALLAWIFIVAWSGRLVARERLGRPAPARAQTLHQPMATAWVMRQSQSDTDKSKARELLLQHHVKSEQIADVCTSLIHSPNPANVAFVRE